MEVGWVLGVRVSGEAVVQEASKLNANGSQDRAALPTGDSWGMQDYCFRGLGVKAGQSLAPYRCVDCGGRGP